MFNLRLTRRDALKWGAMTLATLALPASAAYAQDKKFTLPDLPYATDALAPVISDETMKLHHGKHHQAYVDKLNKALEKYPEYYSWSVEDLLLKLDSLPQKIRKDVRNQGGGHHNHSMFWKWMAPAGKGGQPDAALAAAINKEFGSLDGFKTKFQEAGASVFGSGWVWLAVGPGKKLSIVTTPNQDSLLLNNGKLRPLLGNDVWEHAYYVDYRNKRPDYLKAWWDVVNWNNVSERFSKAK